MLTRRTLLALSAATTALIWAGPKSWAQGTDATSFVQQLGSNLLAIVNAPGSAEAKKQQLDPVIESAVDVDNIARFCLGRFWRTASPQQQSEFTQLFHAVLLNNITGKLGEFRGVTFNMTNTSQRDGETLVGTLIKRPNQQPNNVQWVVSNATGKLKVVDVVAEGTSLRLTQRSDYAAYLSRNGNSIDALINAMRQQAAA